MQLHNRIKETSTSTGTGQIVLAGAVTGYYRFGNFLSGGNRFDAVFLIEWDGGWELAAGQFFNSAGTHILTRDRVLQSSALGAINNSGTGGQTNLPAGTKTVSMVPIALGQIVHELPDDPLIAVPPRADSGDAIAFGRAALAEAIEGMAMGPDTWVRHRSGIALGAGMDSCGKGAFSVGSGWVGDDPLNGQVGHAEQVRGYLGNWSTLATLDVSRASGVLMMVELTIMIDCPAGRYVGLLRYLIDGDTVSVLTAASTIASTLAPTPTFTLLTNNGFYGGPKIEIVLQWNNPQAANRTVLRSKMFGIV